MCLIDPTCCESAWDALCAGLAQDEPLCDCPDCGDVGAGDCCDANGTPFCDDADCCDAVCLIDPTCCDSAWDALCVELAQDEPLCDCPDCGDVGAGDCCEANGTPFCNDADCCDAVCLIDPTCCDSDWDALCAGLAQQECAIVCPLPGACCFPDGSCLDALTLDECEAMTGGEFQGIDTECLGANSTIIVWGVDDRGSADSQLFVLNISTNDLTLVGPEHDGADIEGMTFFGTQVAGVTGIPADDHFLVDMNFITGALTTIAEVDLGPGNSEVTGMATDGNDVQWAFAEARGFGTIDIAGNFTLVIPSETEIEGLAAALDGETLWGITDDGKIYEIDVSAGTVVQIDDVSSQFDDNHIENLELFSSNELAFFAEYSDGDDDLVFVIYNIDTGQLMTTELRDHDLEDIETFVFASITSCPSSLAILGCGTAQSGDCCSENSTTGCLDADCCEIVCGMDPYCCATQWDAICAGEADVACGELCACAQPVVESHAEIVTGFAGANDGFGTQGPNGGDPQSSLPYGYGCSLQVSWEAFSATGCDLTYDAVVQMSGQAIPVTNGQIIEVNCPWTNGAADEISFALEAGGSPTALVLLIVTVQDEVGNEVTEVLDLCEICEASGDDNTPGVSAPIDPTGAGDHASPDQ